MFSIADYVNCHVFFYCLAYYSLMLGLVVTLIWNLWILHPICIIIINSFKNIFTSIKLYNYLVIIKYILDILDIICKGKKLENTKHCLFDQLLFTQYLLLCCRCLWLLWNIFWASIFTYYYVHYLYENYFVMCLALIQAPHSLNSLQICTSFYDICDILTITNELLLVTSNLYHFDCNCC